MEDRDNAVMTDREDLIEGRNAVAEALRAGRTIDKLFVARGETDRALARIVSRAREQGIVVTECDRRKLDAMSVTHAHQGVIAQAAVREYASLDDILAYAAERGEDPFVVVCDEIADPHNLGAIIRTAECAGVHGVVIPKRRSAGLTAVVEDLGDLQLEQTLDQTGVSPGNEHLRSAGQLAHLDHVDLDAVALGEGLPLDGLAGGKHGLGVLGVGVDLDRNAARTVVHTPIARR